MIYSDIFWSRYRRCIILLFLFGLDYGAIEANEGSRPLIFTICG